MAGSTLQSVEETRELISSVPTLECVSFMMPTKGLHKLKRQLGLKNRHESSPDNGASKIQNLFNHCHINLNYQYKKKKRKLSGNPRDTAHHMHYGISEP